MTFLFTPVVKVLAVSKTKGDRLFLIVIVVEMLKEGF